MEMITKRQHIGITWGLASATWLLCLFGALAQEGPVIRSAVDTAAIRIGEQIRFTVEVEADSAASVIFPEGQTFSQQMVTSTEEYLTRRLGNEGYNFAKVTAIPEINEEDHTVALKFFVDPGKRTYVRRISFRGNLKTSDDVLRREMRQMESAPASAAAPRSRASQAR